MRFHHSVAIPPPCAAHHTRSPRSGATARDSDPTEHPELPKQPTRTHTRIACLGARAYARSIGNQLCFKGSLTFKVVSTRAGACGYSGRELGRANRFSSSISSAFALVARKTASEAQLARAARDAPCSGLRRDRPLSREHGHCDRRTQRSRRMRIGFEIRLGRAMQCNAMRTHGGDQKCR